MTSNSREAKVTIKAVVWDMGGVLLRTEDLTPRQTWANRLGISVDELSQLVFEGEASRRASVGKGTVEAIWGGLADRFDLTEAERDQLEHDFWSGDEVDRDLLAYVRELRPAYRTALLSNAWPDVRHFIENVWSFADAFDNVIISAEVGLAKPDPRIYQLTLNRLECQAQETVFIDDFKENVEGARQVGMHAIRFQSASQVKSDLANLLTVSQAD